MIFKSILLSTLKFNWITVLLKWRLYYYSKLLSQIRTTFLPTGLLIVTDYFKYVVFNTIVSVNLTGMLVLKILYSSTPGWMRRGRSSAVANHGLPGKKRTRLAWYRYRCIKVLVHQYDAQNWSERLACAVTELSVHY